MKIMLSNVRLAFPQVFKPATVNGEGEPAYSAALLLGADHPQLEAIRAAQEACGKEKWGDKWAQVKKEITTKDRFALHDGDTKADYDGFAGMKFVTTRSKVRPTVVDRDRSPLTAADGKPYSGCFCNVIIELWAQDNQYGKRINAKLRAVQFVKDGEEFGGGGIDINREFTAIADDDESPV